MPTRNAGTTTSKQATSIFYSLTQKTSKAMKAINTPPPPKLVWQESKFKSGRSIWKSSFLGMEFSVHEMEDGSFRRSGYNTFFGTAEEGKQHCQALFDSKWEEGFSSGKVENSPAPEKNGEKQPDWQSEVEAFDNKAMEALNWVYDAIKGGTVQVEFIDQKGVFTDSVRWTGHVVHLAHGHRIANYHEQMSHYDKIRVAAAVQKELSTKA